MSNLFQYPTELKKTLITYRCFEAFSRTSLLVMIFFLSIHPFLYVMNFCFASQYHSVTNKCDLVSNCDRHKKSVSFFKTPLLKLRTNNWKHQNTRAWETWFWLESFCNCIQNGIRFQITYSFPDYRITISVLFSLAEA